jgi:hypothetical protein
MVSPRHKNTVLCVLASHDNDVREIDEFGKPLMACRTVGKVNGEVISAGVVIPYHSYYIARLKEGSLFALDASTAKLAGVSMVVQHKKETK